MGRRSEKKRKKWCRRAESNRRPRDYETLALPLSYTGTKRVDVKRAILGCQATAHRQAPGSAENPCFASTFRWKPNRISA
jgi:hypothetical protein